ncbi:MAG: hypothetical protein J0M03_15845 [Acidobacteria bacterium]|nr:hypothetical protein [Acidobacteriota bacterium]
MSIKIEGLCGITVKNGVLYALLPNFRAGGKPYANSPEDLVPHYPAILLQYESLATGREWIQYQKIHSQDTIKYGLVFPDSEEVSFSLQGNNNLNDSNAVNTAKQNFIEMPKVHEGEAQSVLNALKLNAKLTNLQQSLSIIKSQTPNIDLACRVAITQGILGKEDDSSDKYSFSYTNTGAYSNKRSFPAVLHVNTIVKSVTIGSKVFTFKANTSPVIRIQNIPSLERARPNHLSKDNDFELSYKLISDSIIQTLTRKTPLYHREGNSERPVICSVIWFETN